MISLDFYKNELKSLKADNQFRQIKDIDSKDDKYIISDERKYLNLSSNNYLGIATNTDYINEFINQIQSPNDLQLGSASSRLLTGTSSIYKKLEFQIAELYNKESALIFNSGYHANIGVISALANKDDVIFSDKLNHASIIDGMKLSGADFYRYKHLDYEHLEQQLIKHRNNYKNAIIITETVFSMDGDIADVARLAVLKEKYNAILITDEAHAFGVFGTNGCGISEEYKDKIDLIVGTFGKAIGSMGAYAVGDKTLIDYLINKARSFIFSTALPPINIAWTSWIIENKLTALKPKQQHLLKLADKFRQELVKYNISTAGSSQIVPAILYSNEQTVKIADKLKHHGYWVLPIRPPTVPINTSRLRFSFSADIEWNEIKNIPEIIAGELK